MDTSLVVQWLRLCAGDTGSIPVLGTKIPHASWPKKKKKKKFLKEENMTPKQGCSEMTLLCKGSRRYPMGHSSQAARPHLSLTKNTDDRCIPGVSGKLLLSTQAKEVQ